MNALHLVPAVASYPVLALMLYLLVRSPRNVPLRAVTIVVACWVLGYALGAPATGGHIPGVEALTARLVQSMLFACAAYSLLCFYLFSALDQPAARRRAIWQAVPLGLASLGMTVAAGLIPPDLREAAARLPSGSPGGPVGMASVALFYLLANAYMTYAFTTTLLWTRRYAKGAEPRLRRGLVIVSVGLVGNVLAFGTFLVANVVRWAGGTMPRWAMLTGIALILFGMLGFLIGVSYPAVVMRLAALRVWWQHRRTYHRLAPLWTILNAEFPEDRLGRVPASRWRERFSLRGVHRRYYRRVIECRDGLVRISPYLGGSAGRTLADRLRDGLRARASGAPVAHRATPVAIPPTDGLEADVRELVRLSQALRTGPRSP